MDEKLTPEGRALAQQLTGLLKAVITEKGVNEIAALVVVASDVSARLQNIKEHWRTTARENTRLKQLLQDLTK